MSASGQIILSPDVVNSLPVYYRCLVQHLADTGRAVIKDASGKPDEKGSS